MTFTEDEVKKAKSKDLKIWVIGTHEEDFTGNIKLDSFYQKYDIDISKYPDIYQKFVTTKEYDEENINQYSKFFNEFAGMYYVWKNNKKSKYVGFSHYRRIVPLSFIDFDELDKGKIQYFSAFYNNKRVTAPILKEILEHKYTYLYEVCCTELANTPHLYKDLENYLDSQNILSQEILINHCSYHKSIREEIFVSRNIFVCKWEEFDKMMRFLSGYFEFIIKTHNINSKQDFIDFYKKDIIKYFIKTWETIETSGYHFFMTLHDENEFKLLTSNDCRYNLFPTFKYWRVYAYMIEILTSVYISSSPKICPRMIECHNITDNDLYFKIEEYINKIKPNNILIFSKDSRLIEIIHYYNNKTNCNIHFVLSNLEKHDIGKYRFNDTNEYKYLTNYRKNHFIKENDILSLNNIDLIILDDVYDSRIIDNIEILDKLNESHCNVIELYGESIENHKTFLDKSKIKYDISIKTNKINYNNIFFINLNKKGED